MFVFFNQGMYFWLILPFWPFQRVERVQCGERGRARDNRVCRGGTKQTNGNLTFTQFLARQSGIVAIELL